MVGFGDGMFWEGGVADTGDDWSHPLYYSQSTDPLYTIHCVTHACLAIEGMQIRIPSAARPAGGGDGHMAVIDQVANMEYDFWQVREKPAGGGTLVVSSGGAVRIGTPDATGLGMQVAPNQPTATAGHYGLAAGIIRPAELAAGEIRHALFLVVKCVRSGFVYPAEQDAASKCCNQADAPALGQHFYLAMTEAQINALAIPEWKKVVLRAIRRYGMFVGDTGGPGFQIQAESGSSFTSFGGEDPWVTLGKQYEVPSSDSSGVRTYSFDLRGAVDWAEHLRVVDPCVSQRTC
jgi:hypothetical protein